MGQQEQAQLMFIKGVIFDLPIERQDLIRQCAARIEEIVNEYGADGYLGAALYGAELAAKQD